MKTFLTAISILLFSIAGFAADRWTIASDGRTIVMAPADTPLPHSDHMEMSGNMMAVVLYWSVDQDRNFNLTKSLVFPMLRTIPNNTHASFMHKDTTDATKGIQVDGTYVNFVTDSIFIDGEMRVSSSIVADDGQDLGLTLRRTIFPTTSHQAMIETFCVINNSCWTQTLTIPSLSTKFISSAEKGVDGSYVIDADLVGAGTYDLAPRQSAEFALVTQAYRLDGESPAALDPAAEHALRRAYVDEIDNNLTLNTPDSAIDTEFRHAKIRGSESICKTKGGYMHAPGGESYYAALWANDQAEYINPFFPFLGYEIGNASALNCFRHYSRFINDAYDPLPCSIIAEGIDIWNGAGDRGDAAMIAYGASRYALARGDIDEARELWPLIEWCLEYCHRRLDENGVVKSDCDELERRFPAGNANLCTASLYYDALISASYLGKELGIDGKRLKTYRRQADELKSAIERHFGTNVSGYDTYRYYDGNNVLRSWICIPLVMGIDNRAAATVDALFSPTMYTADGILTSEGDRVFWDRATLYTLRGALYAGYADQVVERLSDYSRRRLLGDHVPYPIEAWPEGSQRHLSAESGLYCRVITEGLFGIRPTGLRSFDLKPSLPTDWNFAELTHIRAFGQDFDIRIDRDSKPGKLRITLADNSDGKIRRFVIREDSSLSIKFKD